MGGRYLLSVALAIRVKIREQIAQFLKQDIPVLFFLKRPRQMEAKLKKYMVVF